MGFNPNVVVQAHPRLLIIGYPQEYHIGAHLYDAAQELNLCVKLIDASEASASPSIIRQVNWHLRQHRPSRLTSFSRYVIETCQEFRPDYLLVTGITAPEGDALEVIRR